MKRIVIILICICVFTTLITGCAQNTVNTRNQTIDLSKISFLEYESYIGAVIHEEVLIECVVYIPYVTETQDFNTIKNSLINDYEYNLLNDNSKMNISLYDVSVYSIGEKGVMYSLVFCINDLQAGSSNFYEIELFNTQKNESKKYNIGNWLFDTRDYTNKEILELKEATLSSEGAFDFYAVTFLNNSNTNATILDAYVILNNEKISPEIRVFSNFETLMKNQSEIIEKNANVIASKKEKSFKFDYSKNKIENKSVYIKPFIQYKVNNNIEEYLSDNAVKFIYMQDEEILYNNAINS